MEHELILGVRYNNVNLHRAFVVLLEIICIFFKMRFTVYFFLCSVKAAFCPANTRVKPRSDTSL